MSAIIWLFISDTIYTERYMMQPSENYHNYIVSFQWYPLVLCIWQSLLVMLLSLVTNKHKIWLCAELNSHWQGQEFPFSGVSPGSWNSWRWVVPYFCIYFKILRLPTMYSLPLHCWVKIQPHCFPQMAKQWTNGATIFAPIHFFVHFTEASPHKNRPMFMLTKMYV